MYLSCIKANLKIITGGEKKVYKKLNKNKAFTNTG
jgi:hypothetical protein